MKPLERALAAVASVALAVWLGGLVALGAIAAPVVFHVVSMPQSADAMTLVFRRFDLVAMTCAALALACEAARAFGLVGPPPAPVDRVRAGLTTLAAVAATFEGTRLSPRIAELHAAGAIRGMGLAGQELSRLHDLAEACGKIEVALVLAVIVFHAAARGGQRD